jgi:hypothetical protein
MPTALTQFQIDGLHGRNRTIDIPIHDNRLVLVGENGTGGICGSVSFALKNFKGLAMPQSPE